MSIYEYDEVKHMRQTREEGYEDGYNTGYDNGYNKGCENERDKVNLLILGIFLIAASFDLPLVNVSS